MSDFSEMNIDPDDLDEIDFEMESDTPREMMLEAIDAIPSILKQASMIVIKSVKQEFFQKLVDADEAFAELPDAAKELYLEQSVGVFLDKIIDDLKEFRLKLKSDIPSNQVLEDMSEEEFEKFYDSVGDEIEKFILEWVAELKRKFENNEIDPVIFDPLSAND